MTTPVGIADPTHNQPPVQPSANENLDELAKQAQNMYFLYLTFVGFCLLTLFSGHDRDIIFGSGKVSLPLINVQVDILPFYYIGPVLCLMLFITFHLHLLRFVRLVKESNPTDPDHPDRVFPFMLYQSLTKPELGLLGHLQVLIADVSAYYSIVITLIVFTFSTIKLHDPMLLVMTGSVLGMSLFLRAYFYKNAQWPIFTKGRFAEVWRKTSELILVCLACSVALLGVESYIPDTGWQAEINRIGLPSVAGLLLSVWLVHKKWLTTSFPGSLLLILSLVLISFSLFPWRYFSNLKGESFGEPPKFYKEIDELLEEKIGKTQAWFSAPGKYLAYTDLRESIWLNADLRIVNFSYSNLSFSKFIRCNLTGANLSKAELSKANLSKAELSKANLLDANLTDADLTGADLTGADLTGAKLSRKSLQTLLENDTLSKAILSQVDLSGADLSELELYNKINLTKANLSDADLTGTDLTDADLFHSDLTGANLFGAKLSGSDLSKANLLGAKLSGANLRGAKLTNAKLSFTDLSDADLRGADLSGANLRGAKLTSAKLSFTDLSDADLTGAKLSGSDLSDANLSGSDLSDANLTEAKLSGANLTGAYREDETGKKVPLTFDELTEKGVIWMKTPFGLTAKSANPKKL